MFLPALHPRQLSASNVTTTITNSYNAISAQEGVLGVVSIAIGLFLCFFGYKLYKPTLFLAGFLAGAVITYSILARFQPVEGYTNNDTLILLVCFAGGIVFGFLFMCVRKLGLAVIGGIGGFFVAMFILGWKSAGIIESGWGRAIFIIAFVIIGIVLVFFVEKPVIIAATSITGGYQYIMSNFRVIFGIDCFAHTGFRMAAKQFLSSGDKLNLEVFEANGKVIGMTVGVAAFALVGMIVQFRSNLNKHEFK